MTRAFFIILSLLSFYISNTTAQSCNVPGSIKADSKSSTDAVLSWTVVGAPVGAYFQLELIENGQSFSGQPDSSSIASDSIALRNLKASTQYRFKVRTVCGSNTFSAWSAASSFRTYLSNPSACGLNLIAADNSCLPATNHFPIEINTAPGQILGQNVELQAVRLIFEHDWLVDLAIYLRSPDGTRVKLVDSIGSSNDNFGNPLNAQCGNYTEFSNVCTSVSITNTQLAIPPFIGTFFPKENLSKFNTNGLANGTWVLEVCDTKANNVGKLQFLELVFATPTCMPPAAVTVLDAFADGASFRWDTTGVVADSVFIEIGATGFRPNNGKSVFGDTLIRLPYPLTFPLTIGGLKTFSELNAYVRYQCKGFISANSCVIPFFTACKNPSLEENFDNQNNCSTSCGQPCPITGIWQNVLEDDVDWAVHNGTTPSAGTGPDGDFNENGSGKYIYLESSGQCATNKKAELRSQCILINAQPNTCNLTFAYHMKGQVMGKLALDISRDGGQNWQLLWSKTGKQGDNWFQQNINLSMFNGQTVVFRFVGTTVGGTSSDMALDNIRFFGSSLAGAPNVFYVDADNDGYGDSTRIRKFCLSVPPNGYSAVAGDCDDLKSSIHPNAVEVLCNGIDENCNGMMDDSFIETPNARADSTCWGGAVMLKAIGTPKGNFYWLDAAIGGQLLGVGSTLTLQNLKANKTIYLLDSISTMSGGCSSSKKAVTAVAMPIPNLTLGADSGTTCAFSPFDLNTNTVFDSAQSSPTYLWYRSNWSSIPTASVIETQVGFKDYFLVGKTTYGCADTVRFTLKTNAVPTASITQGDSISICIGSTAVLNGKSIGLGLPPFSFSWSNGLNFANIPVNSAAPGQVKTLSLTVSDKNGCSDTKSIKVQTLTSITNTKINSVLDVTQCGGTDGSIALQPLDGQGPYGFSWTGPQVGTTSSNGSVLIGNLAQGAYRITVTDNSSQAGCGMVLPLIVISAPGLAAALDTVLPASCFGASDGTILLDVNGINPSYHWSNGATTKNLTQVKSGNYSVTVVDGACSLTLDSIKVQQPNEILIQANQLEQVKCHGDSSGLIELFVQGGTLPFTYLWSNGITKDSLPNLKKGIYSVTVSDATNCKSYASFNIQEPSPIAINIISATDSVPCFGDAKGTLQVQVSGGTGAYQYLWNNGVLTDKIALVPAGTYTVSVTDGNGCKTQKNRTIYSPDSLKITNIGLQNPICFGVDDGQISIQVLGGTAPFSYKWNDTQTTKNLNGLPEGLYQVTVTDSKLCKAASPILNLISPRIIIPTVDTIKDVACFGDSTGSILLHPTGGLLPYTYYWNQKAGNILHNNLKIGTYIARIVDAQGCQVLTDALEVRQPSAPVVADFAAVEMPLCFGQPNGSLGLHVQGGTKPYTYLWNTGAITPELTGVMAGLYSLKITDAEQCSVSLDTILHNPLQIAAQLPANDTIPCFGSTVGSLCLNPYGGTGALSIQWSNGKIGACQNDLLPGQYVATISDAVGCEKTFGIVEVISQNSLFKITDLFVQGSNCTNDEIAAVQVCVSATKAPYAFSWNAPIGTHSSQRPCDTLTSVQPGRYRLTVTDGFGCTALLDTLITEPNALQMNIPINTAFNPSCFGFADGALCASATGGKTPYNFLWTNGDTDQCIENLPAACYRCTVTDANGCTASISDVVCLSAPPKLHADTILVKHDLCSNNKGALSLKVSGGVPGNPSYFYDWSNGADIQNLTNLPAGQYSLTMTDHVGCTVEAGPFTILPDPTPLITDDQTVTIQGVACKGEHTGRIEVFPQGGVQPYRLDWMNPMVTSFVLENLPKGLYRAILTDGDLCTATYAVQVSEPDEALVISAAYTPANGSNADGTATVSIEGGVKPYAVLWDIGAKHQTSNTATQLSPGFYEVMVNDSVGCMLQTAVEVTSPTTFSSFVQKINLSPNPSDYATHLDIQLEDAQNISIYVYAANGKRMFQQRKVLCKETMESIPTDNLADGLYMLQLVFESGQAVSLPFLVQH